MEKKLLVHTQQHEVIDGNITRSYSIEVYKGLTFHKGYFDFENRNYDQVVEIKAFSILVRETMTLANGTQIFDVVDFGYCTSRSGEFLYALKCMKEDCKNLRDMRFLMADLDDRFHVAMDKDAKKELRKQFGLYKPKPPKPIKAQRN